MDSGLTWGVNEEKTLFLAVKVIFYGALKEIILVQNALFSDFRKPLLSGLLTRAPFLNSGCYSSLCRLKWYL